MKFLKTYETFVPKKMEGRDEKAKEFWYKGFIEESDNVSRAKELIENFKPYLENLRSDEYLSFSPFSAFEEANVTCKYGWKYHDQHSGIWMIDAFKDKEDTLKYGKLLEIIESESGNEHDLDYLNYFTDSRADHITKEIDYRYIETIEGKNYTQDLSIMIIN